MKSQARGRLSLVIVTSLVAIECRLMVWPAVTFEAIVIEAGLAPLSSGRRVALPPIVYEKGVFSKEIEPDRDVAVERDRAVRGDDVAEDGRDALAVGDGRGVPVAGRVPASGGVDVPGECCRGGGLNGAEEAKQGEQNSRQASAATHGGRHGIEGGRRVASCRLYQCSQVGCLLLVNSDPF